MKVKITTYNDAGKAIQCIEIEDAIEKDLKILLEMGVLVARDYKKLVTAIHVEN